MPISPHMPPARLSQTCHPATIDFHHEALMKTAFTARRLSLPSRRFRIPLLVVEDGRISEVSSRSSKEVPGDASLVDFGDAALAPGFFDIHMHGGAGLDVMRASPSELPRLGKFLATHGVTGYFATTVAAPLDATCAALGRLADAIEARRQRPTAIPSRPARWAFILKDRFSATNAVACIRRKIWSSPRVEIFDRLWQAARGHVRMLTIAPGNSGRHGSHRGGSTAQGLREHRALGCRDADR